MQVFNPARPAVDWKKAAGSWLATLYNRNFGVIGAAMHQRRLRVPFGGRYIRIRFIYEVPATVAAWEVAAHAVTSGRQIDEINPKNPDGTDATWQVGAAFTTAAGAGTGQDITESYSPWYTVYVHPEAANPRWGTIVMRTRNTTANAGRGRVLTGSNVTLNLINNVSQNYKDFYEYAASTTAIDSNAITLTSSATLSDSARNITAFQFEIETLGPSKLIIMGGDSRPQGEGSTGNAWGWMARALEQLWNEGENVGYEYHGRQGTTHATTHLMFMDRLNNRPNRRLPDIAIYQPSSTNGSTWTRAQVDADVGRTLEAVSRCRALGIQPVVMTLHPSTSATDATGVANWQRLNEAVKASGVPILDFYSDPTFTNGQPIPALPTNTGITADAGHLNDAGQELAKNRLVYPRLKQLLGLSV